MPLRFVPEDIVRELRRRSGMVADLQSQIRKLKEENLRLLNLVRKQSKRHQVNQQEVP